MSVAAYAPHIVKTGLLNLEEVVAINMPRSTFLAAIEDTLQAHFLSDTADALRDLLLPVAEKMDRFPVGTWIDAERGCGCVIGEYLVASHLINRADAAQYDVVNVQDLLDNQPHGKDLFSFGTWIDIELSRVVVAEMDDGEEAEDIEDLDSVHTLRYFNGGYRDIVIFFTDEA